MPRKKNIDFAELRTIPILEVAEALNLDLKKEGAGVWAMMNSGRTGEGATSLKIFESSNRWKRFSSGDAGSTLDLVMYIRGFTLQEAAEFLSKLL